MTSHPVLSQLRRCASATLCAASLAGCAVGPDFVKPESGLHEVALVPRADYADVAPTSDSDIPSRWWLLFNDAVLAELQLRAQADNLDLQMASERIEQSRAQLGIVSSQLRPSVAASGSHMREALSEHGKFAALGAPTSPSDFWQLGFDASWEIDLWGRARRAREGAAAALEATVYDREAARVALSAEVARTYLQLRGTQAQLDIARQNLTVAERTLRLAENRVRHGVATRFETSSAHAQWATIKAMVPELIQRRNTLMNTLALLLGEKPRALDVQLRETMPLPSLPTSVPVGVPSELARRRPDILRAEAQLHAATAAIGVAKADFYPRIGLRGRIGVEAFESGDLDSWDSRFFSVGPTVYLPIFQGGRLTQRLALNESRQKTAALAYRQTVLRAWHEVDNALDAWAAQQRQHADLSDSYEQNKQALHAAERGYQEGAADYLSVLTAQRNLLASQTGLNASATNAALTLVNLYKSLGGGWDPDALKTSSRVASGDSAEPSSDRAVAIASRVTSPAKANQ
ncbi:efflux transporter outer membrane subunit [Aromatoleum petrolei]|uniref:Efflux transporter outer membrane subunit n=1 Tax=Aromatoleum petrolei TaxID=76116 RepID=A0ABX1MRP1_9RHOO|nr:efflux transporter outer membrane subunit [Aromatoleum petrolei]NMF89010.1 efflux transporter outer membrane subunit [Aromatoleum petrolei]QTQ34370.1 RND efflux system outer membrane lipoprotein, NodT family [Aromatoleum petrolei]